MQQLIDLITQYGLAAVFVNVLLVQLGAPVPAVPTLVIAGAAAIEGRLSFAALLAVAVVASLIGDIAWYAAGRRFGYRVLRTLCSISISPDSCVRQTETIFQRWGVRSLLVAKFIPGFATVAPPLAGAARLALWPFILFSAIGAATWAALAIAAGALFHSQIGQLLDWLSQMGVGALALLGLALAAFIAFKWWERRRFFKALRMARIGVDELNIMIEQGHDPVILDVRSDAARDIDARRIPGALAIDFDNPDRDLVNVPPHRDIILYCT